MKIVLILPCERIRDFSPKLVKSSAISGTGSTAILDTRYLATGCLHTTYGTITNILDVLELILLIVYFSGGQRPWATTVPESERQERSP